jgi:hypothetical protein
MYPQGCPQFSAQLLAHDGYLVFAFGARELGEAKLHGFWVCPISTDKLETDLYISLVIGVARSAEGRIARQKPDQFVR